MSIDSLVEKKTQRLTLTFNENMDSYNATILASLFANLSNLYTYVIGMSLDSNYPSEILTKDPLEMLKELSDYESRYYSKRMSDFFLYLKYYVLKTDKPSLGAAISKYQKGIDKIHVRPDSLDERFYMASYNGKTFSSSLLHLRIGSINYNSPMNVVLLGSVSVLILCVAISGGEVRYEPKTGEFYAATTGVVDAWKKIRTTLFDEEMAKKQFDILLKNKQDDSNATEND